MTDRFLITDSIDRVKVVATAGIGLVQTTTIVDNAITTHTADTTSVHGIADTSVLATDAEVAAAVAAHSADTTSVHGITDTSVLATDAEVATAVSTHAAVTTSVHGIADTSVLATDAEVAAAVAAHSADTTSVHGIADTSALVTTTDLATHTADTTSVHGIADTSALATDSDVSSAIATHTADTTSVHGIADTSALETTTGAAAKVATHAADTTSVHGIADTSALETTTGAQTRVDTHAADTTNVHGITDTSQLVTTTDLAQLAEDFAEAQEFTERYATPQTARGDDGVWAGAIGVSDDTVPLQNTLDRGNPVGAGTYRITSPLLTRSSGQQHRGQGRGLTIIKADFEGTVFDVDDPDERYSYVEFHDLFIDADVTLDDMVGIDFTRLTLAKAMSVGMVLRGEDCVGILASDATDGTGPYYCEVSGYNFSGGSQPTNIGIRLDREGTAGNEVRAPNRWTIHADRIAACGTACYVQGWGHSFDVCVEAITASGYAFIVGDDDISTSALGTEIFMRYFEPGGGGTQRAVRWAETAIGNRIVQGAWTGGDTANWIEDHSEGQNSHLLNGGTSISQIVDGLHITRDSELHLYSPNGTEYVLTVTNTGILEVNTA